MDLTWGDDGKATNHITALWDGKVIRAADEVNGFYGRSLSAYHAQRGVWQQTWVDSNGTYLDFIGRFHDDKMELRMETERDGKPLILRMVWRDISPMRSNGIGSAPTTAAQHGRPNGKSTTGVKIGRRLRGMRESYQKASIHIRTNLHHPYFHQSYIVAICCLYDCTAGSFSPMRRRGPSITFLVAGRYLRRFAVQRHEQHVKGGGWLACGEHGRLPIQIVQFRIARLLAPLRHITHKFGERQQFLRWPNSRRAATANGITP